MRVAVAVATAVVLASSLAFAQSGEKPLRIVAAENFYGDLAQQLGGSGVKVTSILRNPNQDPHTFDASPSTARDIADAQIIIYNGADYDPWMAHLLSASRSTERKVIIVADLTHRKSGDNPHLWYDPATMPALGKALVAVFESLDPAHKAEYENRFEAFQESLQPMTGKMDAMRQKYAGLDVTATEPVFGYMADALGLTMRNRSFQMAVMNGTEPSATDVAAFENDLRTRRVKVLFYNSQVADDLTARLQTLARDSDVPVVGITETEPAGASYQDWMTGQLDALEKALSGSGS